MDIIAMKNLTAVEKIEIIRKVAIEMSSFEELNRMVESYKEMKKIMDECERAYPDLPLREGSWNDFIDIADGKLRRFFDTTEEFGNFITERETGHEAFGAAMELVFNEHYPKFLEAVGLPPEVN